MTEPLILSPIKGIPNIRKDDDLVSLIWQACTDANIDLQNGDIIVITQKIVSKAEGRLVRLDTVVPSKRALEIADFSGKDARLIELILQESREIVRLTRETIIVEHRLGFICASAGIDHSNVDQNGEPQDANVLLLPENPDASADAIRCGLEALSGVQLGVLIIDSQGRAWRVGVTGMCIGVSNVPLVVDLRGKEDLYKQKLRITVVAAADELAAAASLVMGQADESVPVIHVRGFPYALKPAHITEVLRAKSSDLFR